MSSTQTFDLIVIGAGPGGYVCAFRASQLGLKVALVEKRPTLGGTCLNVGCIPAKTLLASSGHFAFAQKHAAAHGIKLGSVELDLPALLRKKDDVVAKLVGGVTALARARKVTVVTGTATFADATTLHIRPPGDDAAPATATLTAKTIVIATGSAPVELPFLPFDGKTILSSDDALSLPEVPKTLAVIGGGAIGLELGSVWARLGARVTVVEFLQKIAASNDDDVVRHYTRLLGKQGFLFETGATVTGYDATRRILTAMRGETPLAIPADKVLVAVGRRPVSEGLGLDAINITLDGKKRIVVDDHLRTNVPGVWAIGDVVAGPMLAHKAEEDGVAVAERIAGKAGHINRDIIPAIIYTDPELASVGLGEDAAKEKGIAINVGKFNFAANGRAISADATDGFVKIIADAKTDKLLGAQILGRHAGELIGEIVAHMEYGGSAEDLARTIHAHPTMSEAIREAALAVSKSALHAL
ncbi:MAG: dihydrolipoyl dehydrogenase [Opitutaceae bacterium]|jgi:dihydrolipoamide dehydrogenase|nr:dihydrolipoyl dehydrogenase [Opitutaceae bacterium]